MADPNPFAAMTPAEMKKLRQTYKGRTKRPVDPEKLRVNAKPVARPKPNFKAREMPSARSTGRSILGMLENAPEGLADLAVSVPTAAYDYIRTSTPGDVVSDVKRGLSGFVDYISSNPIEALAEMSPVGAAMDAGEMLREASLARDAGDEERAAQIEKFAVPMLLGSVLPVGRAARKAERVAAREGVEAAEKSALAALRDVRPSRENVQKVMAANTNAGRITGERLRPIRELTGGVSNAADDQRRVASLVKDMSGPEGYVERLIVDDAGNVIEGQHRLEALRKLGVTEVPVTEYKDFGRDLSLPDLQKAASDAQSIHPDQANQIAANLAEIFADEGGDMAEVRLYEPPKGFEDAWSAALDKLEAQASTNLSVDPKSSPKTFRVKPAEVASPEPRIEPRKKEAPKVKKLEVELAARKTKPVEEVSIYDLEGKPFITSMSDLSAAGDDIVGVNDVTLSEPMRRMGGQDYMFSQPGSVWASDLGPAGQHVELARRLKTATGEDPVFLPWAMGPTSIDFSHMPRELMLRYAADAMNAKERRGLSKDVRAVVPEFKSVEDPASIEVFREATGKARGALNRLLDQYRDRGGLGIGEARWATTDLPQVGTPLTSLRNVGVIESGAALEPSVHPSYRTSIPGEGVGRLKEPVGALELLPDLMAEAELTDPFGFPVGVVPGVKSPLRSLQMGPKGGVITDKMLRAIEARLAARKNKP